MEKWLENIVDKPLIAHLKSFRVTRLDEDTVLVQLFDDSGECMFSHRTKLGIGRALECSFQVASDDQQTGKQQ